MEHIRKFEPPQPPVVALVTDFGLSDAYVSEVHAALWRVCYSLRIVDITHLVPPGDVGSGSYVLW